jgi:hypothetical protein
LYVKSFRAKKCTKIAVMGFYQDPEMALRLQVVGHEQLKHEQEKVSRKADQHRLVLKATPRGSMPSSFLKIFSPKKFAKQLAISACTAFC